MPAITRILFPFDFSAQARQTAPFVRALADRFGATVTILSVVPPTWAPPPAGMPPLAGDGPPEWTVALQRELDLALLEEFHGVRVERLAVAGDPAIRIVAHAEANHTDLIMMPTHGLGAFRSFLVGSVTSKVLHDARCAVWTAAHTDTQTAHTAPGSLVCAVDSTADSLALLHWAGSFAERFGARLAVHHAVGSISDWPALDRERHLQEEVRQAAEARVARLLDAAGLVAPLRVVVGDPVRTVAEAAAQEHADLVIIGRGSVAEPFGRLRTHAYGIIQRSPCPVLSV